MTGDQKREAVLEALVKATTDGSVQAAALDDLPDNLLEIVDSFGFVQLVFALEERLTIDLDLEGVELGDLTQPMTLIRFLQSQANNDAAMT